MISVSTAKELTEQCSNARLGIDTVIDSYIYDASTHGLHKVIVPQLTLSSVEDIIDAYKDNGYTVTPHYDSNTSVVTSIDIEW